MYVECVPYAKVWACRGMNPYEPEGTLALCYEPSRYQFKEALRSISPILKMFQARLVTLGLFTEEVGPS